MSQQSQLIDDIFESSHFQILLKQQVTTLMNSMNQSRRLCSAAIPSIVTEIGNHIDSIIQFQVKNSFNEQYTTHLQHNYELRKDVDEIKIELEKFNLRPSTESTIVSISKLDTSRDLEVNRSRQREKEKGPSDNLQMAKIQKEIESLKLSVQKVSNTNILEFVSESNLQLHKRIEQKYCKLQHEIHQMSQRNLDTSLEKSTADMLDLKYETLEQRLETINRNQKQLIDRFKGLQAGIMDKYETNFSSVWNVITHMEMSLKNSNKKEKPQQPEQLENLRSFVSPSSKSSKKISFSNILSGLGLN